MKWLFAALLAAAAATAAAATESADPSPLSRCIEKHVPSSVPFQQRLAALEETRSACARVVGDEIRLREAAATVAIYENQKTQGRILLVMVVLITVSGIVLAAAQLWGSYKLALRGQGAFAEGGDLTVGPGSIAVKSSVVGVVILALSLAFFFVYVTEVYRLRALEVEKGPGSPGPPAQPQGPPGGMVEVTQ